MNGYIVRGSDKGKAYVFDTEGNSALDYKRGEFEGLKALVENMNYQLYQAGSMREYLAREYADALAWYAEHASKLPAVDEGRAQEGQPQWLYWMGNDVEFQEELRKGCEWSLGLLRDAERAARNKTERTLIANMMIDLKFILRKLGYVENKQVTEPSPEIEVLMMPGEPKVREEEEVQRLTVHVDDEQGRKTVAEIGPEQILRLANLSDREEEVFKMRVNGGLSYKQIGEMCGISRDSVVQYSKRAMKKIKTVKKLLGV
jgi:RNA polymerase sigma factor (sigma-70 family)